MTENTRSLLLHYEWWHGGLTSADVRVGPSAWPRVQAIDFTDYPLPIGIAYEAQQNGHPSWHTSVDLWQQSLEPMVLASLGKRPAYLTLDEPRTHRKDLELPLETAQSTANVINALGYPIWYYEAYPALSADEILEQVRYLAWNATEYMDSFVLDVNFAAFTHGTWQQWIADVDKIRDECVAHSVRFKVAGIAQKMQWDDPPWTNVAYYQSANDYMNHVQAHTDYLIVESWAEGTDGNLSAPTCLGDYSLSQLLAKRDHCDNWVMPPPVVVEPPPPALNLPTGPIKSDFLSHGYMTLLLPAYPASERAVVLDRHKAMGYKDIDLYGFSTKDNPYREPHHRITSLNQPFNAAVEARLKGLRVTLWCLADEIDLTLDQAIQKVKDIVAKCDDVVDRYVLALEENETFRDEVELGPLWETLLAATDKPCYNHRLAGDNAGPSYGAKGIFYQFRGTTPAEVRAEAKAKRGKWKDQGKSFIAGEFPFSVVKNNPSYARTLGNAVDDLVDGRVNG